MSSLRLARNSRFQKGSGLYVCRMCKRSTRSTGGDGAGVQACDICYELAGEENSLSDSGKLYGSKEGIAAMMAQLDKLAGAGTARRVFPEVADAAGYGYVPKIEEPAAAEKVVAEAVVAAARVIDVTPTWVAVMPILLAALEVGNAEGKATAKAELFRMAGIADKYNAMVRGG